MEEATFPSVEGSKAPLKKEGAFLAREKYMGDIILGKCSNENNFNFIAVL